MNKHLRQQLRTIKYTFANYDQKSATRLITECIATLKTGGKIVASGLGKNVPICEKFIGTLNSVGVDSHFLHTNSAMHGDLGLVKQNDLVILLSKSGKTEETCALAKYLKSRGSNNWLLTCTKHSDTQKILGNAVCLPIDNEGDLWDIIPNNSTLVFLIFLQAVAMELIEKLEVPLATFKKNHPGGAIGKKLRRSI